MNESLKRRLRTTFYYAVIWTVGRVLIPRFAMPFLYDHTEPEVWGYAAINFLVALPLSYVFIVYMDKKKKGVPQ